MMHQRGYTLIELSVVLVVLGLVAIGTSKLLLHAPAKLSNQSGSLPAAMFTVDAALKGFLFAQSRLPCPAADSLGVESCVGGSAVGQVPWRTLGLAVMPKNRAGLSLRYGVYRAANVTLFADADLAQSFDRFNPLLPVLNALPPNVVRAAVTPTAQVNALDLCMGLRNAMTTPLSSAVRVNVPSGLLQRAYVLVDPGSTDADSNAVTVSVFDGLNATATTNNQFERPDRVISATYNDQVFAVGFVELWEEMQCSATMSAVHAHANVATSAVILQQALKDYRAQLVVINPLSIAGVIAANEIQTYVGTGGINYNVQALTAAKITTALGVISPPSMLPNGTTPPLTTHAGNAIYSNHSATGLWYTNGWVWRAGRLTGNWYYWRGAWHWQSGGPVYLTAAGWRWSPQPEWLLTIANANSTLAGNYVTEFDNVFGTLSTWNALTTTVRSNADNADRAGVFGQ